MHIHRDKDYYAGFWGDEITQVPELPILGEAWVPADFKINEHVNRGHSWEFQLQTEGETHWVFAGTPMDLRAGEMYIVAPGVKHKTLPKSNNEGAFLFCSIELEMVISGNPEMRKRCAPWMRKRFLKIPDAAEMKPTLRRLIHEASRASADRPAILRALIALFLLEINRLLASSSKENSPLHIHPGVARAMEIMDRQYHKPWTLSELAKNADMSESHFTVTFRRNAGTSPHHYLLQRRIESARELIAHSDRKITDIALDLGFSSSQHFAREFKKLTGKAPRDFRERA